MHVALNPNLLNPFFAYNCHTMIPPLPMRTKLHSCDLPPLKAHIVRLRRACSGSTPPFRGWKQSFNSHGLLVQPLPFLARCPKILISLQYISY